MNHKKSAAALPAALAGEVIFGFTFLFSKIALSVADPLILIADRYILAFISLVLVILITRRRVSFKGKKLLKLFLLALCQPVMYFLCESYGILYTTTSFSSVMIALIPMVTALLGIVFLREQPTLLQLACIFISVVGVILMTLRGKADGTVTVPGIILLIGAVFAGSIYTILSRSISTEFTALERTLAMAFVGLVTFTGIALISVRGQFLLLLKPFRSGAFCVSILYLGIVSSVAAFFLLNYAANYLPVAKSASLVSIVPIVSVFAGVIFLRERLDLLEVLATAMIILSVLGVQLFDKKRFPNDGNSDTIRAERR